MFIGMIYAAFHQVLNPNMIVLSQSLFYGFHISSIFLNSHLLVMLYITVFQLSVWSICTCIFKNKTHWYLVGFEPESSWLRSTPMTTEPLKIVKLKIIFIIKLDVIYIHMYVTSEINIYLTFVKSNDQKIYYKLINIRISF